MLAELDEEGRTSALELLFGLVRVDPEGVRHARKRMRIAHAETVAGGGERGRELLNRLAGQRIAGRTGGPVRLITITEDRWVNLIHETLIRSKGLDAVGKPQPYWPTLWGYIEEHKERAVWRERLREDVAAWLAKGRGAGHQWSHERVREAAEALRPMIAELNPDEREFLGPIDPEEMLAELERPETTHKRRLLIGERLDVLSEQPSRWDVGVDTNRTPTVNWRPVPGGDLTVRPE